MLADVVLECLNLTSISYASKDRFQWCTPKFVNPELMLKPSPVYTTLSCLQLDYTMETISIQLNNGLIRQYFLMFSSRFVMIPSTRIS